jgi:hypothetical protein
VGLKKDDPRIAKQALGSKEFQCVRKAIASEGMSFSQIVLFHFLMKADDDFISQFQGILSLE